MKKGLLFFFILLVVALSAIYPHTWISPGELVNGHQKLNNQCSACHSPFGGIVNSKCISCHKLSEIGKENINTIFFHERLKNSSCVSCHADHKGMIQDNTLMKFEHDLLSEEDKINCNACHKAPNSGSHKYFLNTCNSCHTNEVWKTTTKFSHEMIEANQRQNCTLCHSAPTDNMHKDFGRDCISCHSLDQWNPSSFNHENYFAFDVNHHSTCTNCHSNNNFKAYSCTNCHEHSANKLFNEHAEEGISDILNGVRCHRIGNAEDGEESNGRGEDD